MAGLYIHIPFCSQRCVYCDFYFTTTKQSHATFVQALCNEIAYYGATHGRKEKIETIYFGGGTPSLLLEDELRQILQTMFDHFDTSSLAEVTLELNPEDVDLDYLRGLHALGVNRLSIGIQSFFQSDLAFMNRSHSVDQAERIIPLARKAGFENLTADLIFGLPDQPDEYWAANLQKMADFEVPHLSAYSLTVEEKTPLHNLVERGLVSPSEDDVLADRYRFTMDYLRERGYEHYEISSFARPGHRSRHNQLYWTHTNYLGFGPSAHAFWWKTGSAAERWSNVRNLRQYEALLGTMQVPLDARELLDLDTLADEYIMLRLRTADGLDLDHLERRYGVDLLVEKTDELAWLESERYIHPIRNHTVRLTDEGKLLANSVTSRLLAE